MADAALCIGDRCNWVNQAERLVYLGRNWSGNGFWHQFALVEAPGKVWCEVPDGALDRIERTEEEQSKES